MHQIAAFMQNFLGEHAPVPTPFSPNKLVVFFVVVADILSYFCLEIGLRYTLKCTKLQHFKILYPFKHMYEIMIWKSKRKQFKLLFYWSDIQIILEKYKSKYKSLNIITLKIISGLKYYVPMFMLKLLYNTIIIPLWGYRPDIIFTKKSSAK